MPVKGQAMPQSILRSGVFLTGFGMIEDDENAA
jgi:hypothetical protein